MLTLRNLIIIPNCYFTNNFRTNSSRFHIKNPLSSRLGLAVIFQSQTSSTLTLANLNMLNLANHTHSTLSQYFNKFLTAISRNDQHSFFRCNSTTGSTQHIICCVFTPFNEEDSHFYITSNIQRTNMLLQLQLTPHFSSSNTSLHSYLPRCFHRHSRVISLDLTSYSILSLTFLLFNFYSYLLSITTYTNSIMDLALIPRSNNGPAVTIHHYSTGILELTMCEQLLQLFPQSLVSFKLVDIQYGC